MTERPSSSPSSLRDSGIIASPDVGVDYYIWSLQVAGIGTMLSGVNLIATIVKMRAPGMSMMKMPIFTWTALCTNVLIVAAFPVLTAVLVVVLTEAAVAGTDPVHERGDIVRIGVVAAHGDACTAHASDFGGIEFGGLGGERSSAEEQPHVGRHHAGADPPDAGARRPEVELDERDPHVIFFTSGSTGRPKGVQIPHRAIANRLLWMQDAYPIGPGDVLLQKTPTSFDVSVITCTARWP